MKEAAPIMSGMSDGTKYLYVDNLMISDEQLKDKKFKVRYRNPKSKIYELILVPQDPEDKKDIETFYKLWYTIKENMAKSRPGQDINIFKILNAEPFKSRVRLEEDPQQMRLSL